MVMGTTPTPDTVSVHFFLSNLVVGKNVIFENLIYPVSFRIIYFCQFVSIDVVLLHLARTLGNVVYYVKKKKKKWVFFFSPSQQDHMLGCSQFSDFTFLCFKPQD